MPETFNFISKPEAKAILGLIEVIVKVLLFNRHVVDEAKFKIEVQLYGP